MVEIFMVSHRVDLDEYDSQHAFAVIFIVLYCCNVTECMHVWREYDSIRQTDIVDARRGQRGWSL